MCHPWDPLHITVLFLTLLFCDGFIYTSQAIKKCLDALKHDAVDVMVSFKDSGKEFDKIESWFKTEYCVHGKFC
jgi:hypothetical protein